MTLSLYLGKSGEKSEDLKLAVVQAVTAMVRAATPTVLGTYRYRTVLVIRETREGWGPCWLLKMRWIGTQRVQMRWEWSILGWFLPCRASTIDFCLALAALFSPLQNLIFLTAHFFTLLVPIARQPGQAGVLGRLCLWSIVGYSSEIGVADSVLWTKCKKLLAFWAVHIQIFSLAHVVHLSQKSFRRPLSKKSRFTNVSVQYCRKVVPSFVGLWPSLYLQFARNWGELLLVEDLATGIGTLYCTS